MQKLMQEAQKMQAKLMKEQEEIEKTTYEGSSSNVSVVVNGKKDVVSVKLNLDDDFSKDDVELLEDRKRRIGSFAIKYGSSFSIGDV